MTITQYSLSTAKETGICPETEMRAIKSTWIRARKTSKEKKTSLMVKG